MLDYIQEKLCSNCSHMEKDDSCTQYGQGVLISFDHKHPSCNHFEGKGIDVPKNPDCPMHGKPLEECLFRVLYFLESHLLVDWHYMEGEGFYRDKTALVEDIRKTLDIGNAGR